MKYLFIIFIFIICGLLSPAATQESKDSIPKVTMPEKAYTTLRQALESYPFSPRGEKEFLPRNLAALEMLRGLSYPDLSKLEWMRLYSLKDNKRFADAWGMPVKDDEIVLVLADFSERRVKRSAFSKIETADYRKEVAELIEYLKKRDPESRRPWDFTVINDVVGGGMPFGGGVFLINHAYSTAQFGMEKEAAFLVNEALKQRELAFENAYNELAWISFYTGIGMLEKGESRAEVLVQFENTLKAYGESRYKEQLNDLVSELGKQVEEEKEIAKTNVDDPETLPLDKRIPYYIARLPDVRGIQVSQPGHCSTTGMGERTKTSDSLVAIGQPAVPF